MILKETSLAGMFPQSPRCNIWIPNQKKRPNCHILMCRPRELMPCALRPGNLNRSSVLWICLDQKNCHGPFYLHFPEIHCWNLACVYVFGTCYPWIWHLISSIWVTSWQKMKVKWRDMKILPIRYRKYTWLVHIYRVRRARHQVSRAAHQKMPVRTFFFWFGIHVLSTAMFSDDFWKNTIIS